MKRMILFTCLSFLIGVSYAQVDPDTLDGTNKGTYSNFDEEDYTWSVVNCDDGATFTLGVNPEGEDDVGVFTTSSCADEGFQCDIEFVPMDFSIRNSFHVEVFAPAVGRNVAFKVFEKDNPDNSYMVEATTTKEGAWDTLSFDFSDAPDGVFNMWSIHPDYGAENTDEAWFFNMITVARLLVTYDDGMLLDFEDNPNYMFYWDCNDGFAEIVVMDNPMPEGINTSEKVGMFFTSPCTWEGTATREKFVPFDFTDGSIFKVKVLSPAPDLTFMFKIENFEDNTNTPIEVQAQTTTNEGWEEIAFDFSGAESNFYGRIALFPDFGTAEEDLWYFDDVRFEGTLTGVESQVIKLFDYELASANYPNPFNPNTTIAYTVPQESHVKLTVYDLQGRLIETLVDQNMPMGDHSIQFEGSRLASGVYLYRLETDTRTVTNKMLLVK